MASQADLSSRLAAVLAAAEADLKQIAIDAGAAYLSGGLGAAETKAVSEGKNDLSALITLAEGEVVEIAPSLGSVSAGGNAATLPQLIAAVKAIVQTPLASQITSNGVKAAEAAVSTEATNLEHEAVGEVARAEGEVGAFLKRL